jgi:hypothetical protein
MMCSVTGAEKCEIGSTSNGTMWGMHVRTVCDLVLAFCALEIDEICGNKSLQMHTHVLIEKYVADTAQASDSSIVVSQDSTVLIFDRRDNNKEVFSSTDHEGQMYHCFFANNTIMTAGFNDRGLSLLFHALPRLRRDLHMCACAVRLWEF